MMVIKNKIIILVWIVKFIYVTEHIKCYYFQEITYLSYFLEIDIFHRKIRVSLHLLNNFYNILRNVYISKRWTNVLFDLPIIR